MPNKILLDEIRVQIDSIDDDILQLLEKRVSLVKKVGEIKNKEHSNIYVPSRERSILDRLHNKSQDIPHISIDNIFLEIFSMSRNIEKVEKVSFLGPEGSFTHQSAINKFGITTEYIPSNTIESVFTMVENNQCIYGVIPVENSSNGIVNDTIEALKKYDDIYIIAENIIDIHHCLSTTCANINDIKTIYSKDIAFAQCKNFLYSNNLGEDKVRWVHTDSTSAGALLSTKEENSACICSRASSKINKLQVLFDSIEDMSHNKTRFLVISKNKNKISGNDKSSILVSLPNKSGILYEFLKSFYEANIDLIKIKSHISLGITSFFIEFIGHIDDEKITNIISKHKDNIKILGSYIMECDDI
jgi:chorismate mutase/prephenate dehydratase